MPRWTMLTLSLLLSTSIPACGGSDPSDGPGSPHGETTADDEWPEGTAIDLSAQGCEASFEGGVTVHYNGNLAAIFVDPDTYTFRASVSFDLPSGFSGNAPNPEVYDPDRPRHTVAMSDVDFTTYGNHCWPVDDDGPHGRLTIDAYDPDEGVVRATFDHYVLKSCTSSATCTLTGSVETSELGVFYD